MPGHVFDPVKVLQERFARAIARAFPDQAGAGQAGIDAAVSPSKNPKFGDFQCNAAMALGKAMGKPPREVAEKIVANLEAADLAEPVTSANIAGPGFINVTIRADALATWLGAMSGSELGIEKPTKPLTFVVDLCGVNLAKQMHIGHLRATVIGDTLARVISRLGHKAIRQNHVGDWGLPIAMVASRLIDDSAAGRIDLNKLTLDDLDRTYKAAQRECDADEKGLESARKWGMGPKAIAELEAQVGGANEALARARGVLLKMQAKESATFGVWQRISDVTMTECLKICQRLNADLRPEHSAGESSYASELAGIVDDLVSKGIAVPMDGALGVTIEGIEEPLFVRRSDGGFVYATTDLAALRRRVQKFDADELVYAVDARQSLHFKQFFAVAARAGYLDRPGKARSIAEHAAFGTILGDDGRPFKTRSGESVRLSDVIDEAEDRAAATVAEKNPTLSDGERHEIAHAVAVAAIRYTDLSNERIKDYVFSLDRMLAFEGNTGPYLLYALVRIRSIFRKAAERTVDVRGAEHGAFVVSHPAEKGLAMALLAYPSAVASVADGMLPHRLCGYLYELAGRFSTFFDACPVLAAEDEARRNARLRLCRLTERVLADGLGLLGIPTLERM